MGNEKKIMSSKLMNWPHRRWSKEGGMRGNWKEIWWIQEFVPRGRMDFNEKKIISLKIKPPQKIHSISFLLWSQLVRKSKKNELNRRKNPKRVKKHRFLKKKAKLKSSKINSLPLPNPNFDDWSWVTSPRRLWNCIDLSTAVWGESYCYVNWGEGTRKNSWKKIWEGERGRELWCLLP